MSWTSEWRLRAALARDRRDAAEADPAADRASDPERGRDAASGGGRAGGPDRMDSRVIEVRTEARPSLARPEAEAELRPVTALDEEDGADADAGGGPPRPSADLAASRLDMVVCFRGPSRVPGFFVYAACRPLIWKWDRRVLRANGDAMDSCPGAKIYRVIGKWKMEVSDATPGFDTAPLFGLKKVVDIDEMQLRHLNWSWSLK